MPKKLNYFKTRPKASLINATGYLERLGLESRPPDYTFLKALHRAHLLHIPFEDLDIHYHKKIVLDIQSLFDKVVTRKRGGLCYELNALFYHLLSQLGYNAYLASARVYKDSGLTPEFDHMVIIVMLPGSKYLVDVGFGSSFVEPKKIGVEVQLDYTTYYKFVKDQDDRLILRKSKDGSVFESVYKFDLASRELIEFIQRCDYHQESADSYFKQTKLITQLVPDGRVTLTDRLLKVHRSGEYREYPIMNEDEFLSKLEEHFGIDKWALLRQQLD